MRLAPRLAGGIAGIGWLFGLSSASGHIPPPPDTLRILANNTHHGAGLDGVLDRERIASVIRSVDPDVVALQEVDQGVERTDRVVQAGAYGSLTGMEAVFGAFMEYQGGRYGMALLSRHPILSWENHRLPPGAEPRSALTARIRMPASGREVVVAGIHFYRTEEERMAQARRTAEILEPHTVPVLLAGDFNSLPGSPVMELLAQGWAVPEKEGPRYTFPADEPAREIDFILVRPHDGFRVLEYRVLEDPVASDHRPVLMVVEIH